MARPEQYPVKKLIGFSDETVARIEDWRRKQTPIPNFSEAVRQIVDLHLASGAPKVTNWK